MLNGLYINRDATMLDLIKDAWGVSGDDVAGGPGWMSYDVFDVVAKVPAGTSGAAANLMLQSLLSDRFGLKRASRDAAGAALPSDGRHKGSKLTPSNPADRPGCDSRNLPGPMPKIKFTLSAMLPVRALRKISVRWPPSMSITTPWMRT